MPGGRRLTGMKVPGIIFQSRISASLMQKLVVREPICETKEALRHQEQ